MQIPYQPASQPASQHHNNCHCRHTATSECIYHAGYNTTSPVRTATATAATTKVLLLLFLLLYSCCRTTYRHCHCHYLCGRCLISQPGLLLLLLLLLLNHSSVSASAFAFASACSPSPWTQSRPPPPSPLSPAPEPGASKPDSTAMMSDHCAVSEVPSAEADATSHYEREHASEPDARADDWAHTADRKAKKRMQNRVAQRSYRKLS